MSIQNIFSFDPEKSIETILYVSCRIQSPCKHSISKLLYFADREHLAEFGRLISGDSYRAIKFGPIPDNTLDIINAANNPTKASHAKHEDIRGAFALDGYNIQPKRNEDQSKLSKSEIMCLDHVIEQYGNKSFTELTDISHDESWNSVSLNNIIPLENIVNTLPNPEELTDYIVNG
ncbi:MAG: Panacea domain-containing protein [Woeseiaceae bacterium]